MAVVAYNFHTNWKQSEPTHFKNLLSCIKLPAVSSFQSKVKAIEIIAHERQQEAKTSAEKSDLTRFSRLMTCNSRLVPY